MAATAAAGTMLASLLATAAAESELVAAGGEVPPGGEVGAGEAPVAPEGEAPPPPESGTPSSAPAPSPRAAGAPRQRNRASAAGRPVQATGARMRFTQEENEVLARAVAENRGLPTKKSASGIRWAEIQARTPCANAPALAAR